MPVRASTNSSVVHLTVVALREALLDARRDTVTHRATITGRIFDLKLGYPSLKLDLRAKYRLHSALAGS